MNEIWTTIPEFPNYQVSNTGKVKHIQTDFIRYKNGTPYIYHKKEQVLKNAYNKAGLAYVNLHNESGIRKFNISQLVAEVYLPNLERYDTVVNIDNNRQNNCVENLKWAGEKLFLEGEVWLDMVDGFGYYQVSNIGRVKSIKHGGYNIHRILKQRLNKFGYPYVCVWVHSKRRMRSIHRMVAEAFIPNPNNFKCINHKDFNPLNAKVENLEWCTQVYNIRYSMEAGRIDKRGEKNATSKLTREQGLQALEMLRNSNVKTKDIAKHFNVTRGAIDAINSGRNWKHLSENYPIRKSTRSRRNISVAKLDLKNN